MAARSPIFEGVDPVLLQAVQAVIQNYGPYSATINSAYRAGDPRFHGRGKALDVTLYDRDSGRALKNIGSGETAPMYQALANAIYQRMMQSNPEMAQKLRWGGYFAGGKNPLDLMHFDVGGGPGGVPMAGGSWQGGFTPEMQQQWKIGQAGGLSGGAGGTGPAMPSETYDYTPEQRRNAIAGIESAGSGDYKALGPVTNRQGNRAYGRYQVMASNIPSWTKQALGTEMTPDQFLASPEAQDKVFDTIFGGYVNKYGEQGAASMWFTGRPSAPNAKDKLGTTGRGYIDKYMAGLGKPGTSTATGQGGTSQVAGAGATGTADLAAIYSKMYGGGKADRKGVGEVLGGAIANMGAGSDKIGMGNAPQLPQSAPSILPSMPTVDPQQAEARRQQLAYAMQRLNQGTLI